MNNFLENEICYFEEMPKRDVQFRQNLNICLFIGLWSLAALLYNCLPWHQNLLPICSLLHGLTFLSGCMGDSISGNELCHG